MAKKKREVVVWVYCGKACGHYESDDTYQHPSVCMEDMSPHAITEDCGCVNYRLADSDQGRHVPDVLEHFLVAKVGEKRKYRIIVEEIV